MTSYSPLAVVTSDPSSPSSPLADLRDELATIDPGSVILKVDHRPGWSAVFGLGIEGAQLNGWRRAARKPDGEVDELLWQRMICAAQCVGLRRDSKAVHDSAGRPVTFSSPELWSMLGVPAGSPDGAQAAVKRFYGTDFAVASVADRVLSDAGFGKAAEEEHPTPGSSAS